MSPLVADATGLLRAFEEGEEVDPDRIDSLVRRVRAVANGLEPAELRTLIETIRSLENAVQAHLTDLGREIRKTGANRRALRGYSHLRSHTTAQRLNTQG